MMILPGFFMDLWNHKGLQIKQGLLLTWLMDKRRIPDHMKKGFINIPEVKIETQTCLKCAFQETTLIYIK